MQLTLYVPGLLLPQAVLEDTVFDLASPALSLLLGRGQRSSTDPDWLARAFGLQDPLPVAALRKVGTAMTASAEDEARLSAQTKVGVTERNPYFGTGRTAKADWLCLDPVHWSVTRDAITLTETMLDEAEATALIEALQPLFAEWGSLSASTPGHWELQLVRSLMLETRPLTHSINQPVDPGLPAGLDGPAWRRLLAEAQTVLHAHPVNRQREALGRPSINSLWPWGHGSLPEATVTDFDVVWSSDPKLAGLSSLAGIPCVLPPAGFQPATGNVLHCSDVLARPAQSLDALAWREALMALERDWLAPAIAALQRNDCQALCLVGTGFHDIPRATLFSLVRGNLWRFWRRPAPLTELA